MRRPRPEFFVDGVGDRCLQTCMQMMLWTLGVERSDEEINHLTQYETGRNSQFSLATLAMAQLLQTGVRLYTQLDFGRYAAEGENYLAETYSPEWLAHQSRLSSPGFVKEITAAKRLADSGLWEQAELNRKLVSGLVEQGNALILSLDAGKLYRHGNVSAHAVLVFNEYRRRYWFHDPGGEDGEDLTAPRAMFCAAIRTHVLAIPFEDQYT